MVWERDYLVPRRSLVPRERSSGNMTRNETWERASVWERDYCLDGRLHDSILATWTSIVNLSVTSSVWNMSQPPSSTSDVPPVQAQRGIVKQVRYVALFVPLPLAKFARQNTYVTCLARSQALLCTRAHVRFKFFGLAM